MEEQTMLLIFQFLIFTFAFLKGIMLRQKFAAHLAGRRYPCNCLQLLTEHISI